MRSKRYVLPLALALCLLLSACGTPEPVPDAGPAAPGEGAVLERLEIVTPPAKTSDESGDTVDLSGLRIDGHYSDGGVAENLPFTAQTEVIGTKTAAISIECMGQLLTLPVDVTVKGNKAEYSVAETPALADSPAAGLTFFWLGSSVTWGAESEGESMADFIGKKYGVTTVKEAVSGTTLAAYAPDSYVERLDAYLARDDRAQRVDAFICQLSTNDTPYTDRYGSVTPDFMTDPALFDTGTTFGALEYIVARAKETWDCPVYVYTNPPTGKPAYGQLVEGLYTLAEKWDVTVIDLYGDEAWGAISDSERALYMADAIHPTRAGYREWWLPKFEQALLGGL